MFITVVISHGLINLIHCVINIHILTIDKTKNLQCRFMLRNKNKKIDNKK